MELRIEEADKDMDPIDLYDDLREEDMLEILGLMHHPRDAVYMSYATSSKCYSVRDEYNTLYCSFGVAPINGTNIGSAWLLGTRKLPNIKKFFLKHSAEKVDDLLQGFDYLTNFVMRSNKLSIRWLEWLGAEFNDCQYENYLSFILERK
tara:strand:- start:380 stop:826 length:447 start_codon:yes stop_codon:yes gene_type:complete